MQLSLKSMWIATKQLFPKNVGDEFVNIAKVWDDHDSGFDIWNNVNAINGNIQNFSFGMTLSSKNSNYAALSTDQLLLIDTSSSSLTLTLPTAVGVAGKQYLVFNVGKNFLTIATTSAQTINGGTSFSLPGKYFSTELFSDGSNWVCR